MKSLLISFLFILFYITSSLSQDYSEIGKYYPTNYKWLRLEDISYDGLKVGYTTYFRKSGNSIWINDTLIANNYIKYINYFLRFNFSLNKVIYKGLVESEDKWALFSNNNRISRPFLKAINLEYYSYSQDFSRILYITEFNDKYRVWLNTINISPLCDEIHKAVMNYDGSKVIYSAKQSGKWAIWINDEKITNDFDNISNFSTNSDFSRIAYIAKTKGSYSVFLNNNEINSGLNEKKYVIIEYDTACNLAYIAGKSFWISNKQISPEKHSVILNAPVFYNSDFSKFTYKAYNPTDPFVYTGMALWINDKKVTPDYGKISYYEFNSDLTQLLYIADGNIYINKKKISLPKNFRTPFLRFIKGFGNIIEIQEVEDPLKINNFTFTYDFSMIAYSHSYYIKGGKIKRSIWINGQQATPEFDKIIFAEEVFRATGVLIFAGYDEEKKEIIHGISNVTIDNLLIE